MYMYVYYVRTVAVEAVETRGSNHDYGDVTPKARHSRLPQKPLCNF